MAKQYFYNPLYEYIAIKYIFVYGLNEEATRDLLGRKKDTYVHKRQDFYGAILDRTSMEVNDFIKKSGKGRSCSPTADHLIHHWKYDDWGNSIYSLYLQGKPDREMWERKILPYRDVLLDPEEFQRRQSWGGASEKEKKSVAETLQALERWGIAKKEEGTDGYEIKEPERLGTSTAIRSELEKYHRQLQRFREMILFFSKFAPLSVIGYSILQRLGAEDTRIPVIVRGQSPFAPLRQENMYRCLLAIANGVFLKYKKELFRAVDLKFADHFLYEKNCNGFVLLEDRQGNRSWQKIPEQTLLEIYESSEQQEDTYLAELWVNDETEGYIVKKAKKIWEPVAAERIGKKAEFRTVYYPECEKWHSIRLRYRVPAREEEAFRSYIRSFGDFVKNFKKISGKETNQTLYSLCTPYNSLLFFDFFRKGAGKDAVSPFTAMELYWLEFILLKYRNFCQMFFDGAFCEQLLTMVQEKIRERGAEKAFRNIFWREKDKGISFFDQKIRDLPNRSCAEKYRKIYEGILTQSCFHTERGPVVPYALTFSVDEYLLGSSRDDAMTIMAYNMQQKRTTIIKYRDFNAFADFPREEYPFTKADIWYHYFAYRVRTEGQLGKEFDFSELCTVGRESDEKQLAKLEALYCRTYKECDEFFTGIPGGEQLRDMAFREILEMVSVNEKLPEAMENANTTESANGRELANNGVEMFSKEELIYRIKILMAFAQVYKAAGEKDRALREALLEETDGEGEKILSQLLFAMILGSQKSAEEMAEITGRYRRKRRSSSVRGKIPELIFDERSFRENIPEKNEISYTNAVLKKKSITFRLKGSRDMATLDLIYEYFRGYNCVARAEGDSIVFQVEYERFHFRKIHEILLALGELIEIQGPEEVVRIMQQRKRKWRKEE